MRVVASRVNEPGLAVTFGRQGNQIHRNGLLAALPCAPEGSVGGDGRAVAAAVPAAQPLARPGHGGQARRQAQQQRQLRATARQTRMARLRNLPRSRGCEVR